jgi:hypothetical protein
MEHIDLPLSEYPYEQKLNLLETLWEDAKKRIKRNVLCE